MALGEPHVPSGSLHSVVPITVPVTSQVYVTSSPGQKATGHAPPEPTLQVKDCASIERGKKERERERKSFMLRVKYSNS